jgi:hypothetical protein
MGWQACPPAVWRAGAAEVKITPPVGVDLSGYAHREGPSLAVHDDLWCRALVLEEGAARLAIISLDLLGLDFALDAATRQSVAQAAEIPPEQVLLNCSHTHAGPAVARLRSLGAPNEGYVASLPGLVAEAVSEAAGRLRPAVAAFGRAPGRAGINRRERTPTGAIAIGRNPEGLTDEWVRVLRLSDPDGRPSTRPAGKPIAVLFNHACHGTTLGGENREITAEWMGAACQALRARLGGEVVPMFLQGCCGQINPDREERSFAQVARIGDKIADSVLAAMEVAQPIAGRLASRLERIQLPLQDPPDLPTARARLAEAERQAESARDAQSVHPYYLRALEELVAYARNVVGLSERGARGLRLPFAVQAMALGDLGVVALSGEVFLDFALQIEAESPFPRTMVLGYSNGCTGYVPTAQAFTEGGYEPDLSFRYYGTLPLAPEAGEEMARAALGLLRELHGP